jgi:hypothetical protein
LFLIVTQNAYTTLKIPVDWTDNPGGIAVNQASGRDIFRYDGSGPDKNMIAHPDFINEDRADPKPAPLSDGGPARYIHAGADMNPVPDYTLMIDNGAVVNNDIVSDSASGINNGACKNNGPFTDHGIGGDQGFRVQYTKQRKSFLEKHPADFNPSKAMTKSQDAGGDSLFGQDIQMFMPAQYLFPFKKLSVSIRVDIIQVADNLYVRIRSQGIDYRTGMP